MDEKEFIIRKKIKDIQNTIESNNKKKIELRNELFKLDQENCQLLLESLELISELEKLKNQKWKIKFKKSIDKQNCLWYNKKVEKLQTKIN